MHWIGDMYLIPGPLNGYTPKFFNRIHFCDQTIIGMALAPLKRGDQPRFIPIRGIFGSGFSLLGLRTYLQTWSWVGLKYFYPFLHMYGNRNSDHHHNYLINGLQVFSVQMSAQSIQKHSPFRWMPNFEPLTIIGGRRVPILQSTWINYKVGL